MSAAAASTTGGYEESATDECEELLAGPVKSGSSSIEENDSQMSPSLSESPLKSDVMFEKGNIIIIKKEADLKSTLQEVLRVSQSRLQEEKMANIKRLQEEKEANEERLKQEKEANKERLKQEKEANEERLKQEKEASKERLKQEKEANKERLQQEKLANEERLQQEKEACKIQFAKLEENIKTLQQEKEANIIKFGKLQKNIKTLQQEKDANTMQFAKLEQNVKTLQREQEAYNIQFAKLEENIKTLRQENKQYELRVAELESRQRNTEENLKIFATSSALIFSSDLFLVKMGTRKNPKTLSRHCYDALSAHKPEYLEILSTLQCPDHQNESATNGLDAMIRSRISLVHPTPSLNQVAARIQDAAKILTILGNKEAFATNNPDLFFACWVLEHYKALLPCASQLPN